jgi:hypothetical protein
MVLLHRLADSATVVTGAVVGLVAHAALPVTFERHGSGDLRKAWLVSLACRKAKDLGLSARIVDNAASAGHARDRPFGAGHCVQDPRRGGRDVSRHCGRS